MGLGALGGESRRTYDQVLFPPLGCCRDERHGNDRSGNYGATSGHIADISGAVLSAANVQVINTDQGATLRSLKTANHGSYTATVLPVGNCQIVIETPGF